jgi:hypothetical protein
VTTINEAISHKQLLNEIATLHNEALTRHLSQSELRIRFNQIKRINADLGQLQFDMMNDPVWEYLTVEDRETLKRHIDATIKCMSW